MHRPPAQENGSTPFGGFRKRTTRLGPLLVDAARLASRSGRLLSIWTGRRMDPNLREIVMVAVARANGCRYCTFAHEQWALLEGTSNQELARLEGMDPEDFDRRRWVALSHARARSLARFGPVDEALDREFHEHFDPAERADIEAVTRLMTLANLSANTVDALLARIRGRPAPGSHLPDELAVALLFALVAPAVVLYLSIRRRTSPLTLVEEFRRFSERFETV